MTYNKLKRLALNLSETITGEISTPSDVYTHVKTLIKNQPEYFKEYLGAENVTKLIIYIWCIKAFDNVEIAEKIFSNITFFALFYTNGEEVEEECNQCDGNGQIECDQCDGNGTISCDTCDGDGVIECVDCDGKGEITKEDGTTEECTFCAGEGLVDCDDCDREGRIECNDCDGRGGYTCNDCDGDGHIRTDEVVCIETFVALWDPSEIDKFKSVMIDDVSLSSEVLDDMVQTKLILFEDHENHELKSWVDEDEYYVLGMTDKPSLYFAGQQVTFDSIKFQNKYRTFIK